MVTHGDHGTSGSNKIDQKTKNVVNTRFFLRIFFPAHFDHWMLRKSFLVVVVGCVGDSSAISLVKESRLLTFSKLNEGDLESTLTSLDQELDKKFLGVKWCGYLVENVLLFVGVEKVSWCENGVAIW